MNKQIYKDSIVIGLALFAMFFGAGSLIFPSFLGMISGDKWPIGFIMFMLVDIGLAFATIIAMTKGNGHISGVTGVLGKLPSIVLNTAVIVCVGPLLAIPRTAATTFEMTITPVLPGMNTLLFSVIFFSFVYFLTIRPSKIVDIIGKFLTPVMFIALLVLIISGLVNPLGPIGQTDANPVKEGVIAGYQAMDVLGALGFAIIIISTMEQKGYSTGNNKNRVITLACILAGSLLFIVYGGLTYLGASVSSIYDISLVNQAGLIVAITEDLLGNNGVVMLGVIVGLACLTTAIGLTSASGSYFEELTKGKVSYTWVVTVITLFSLVVSNFGLSTIISIAVPVLTLVYPIILIVICLSFIKNINHNIIKGSSLFALLVSVVSISPILMENMDWINNLPLAEYGFNWLLPAIIGGIIGNNFKPVTPSKKGKLAFSREDV